MSDRTSKIRSRFRSTTFITSGYWNNPVMINDRNISYISSFPGCSYYDNSILTRVVIGLFQIVIKLITLAPAAIVSIIASDSPELAGRAKSVSARHYALYELDRLTCLWWERLGVRYNNWVRMNMSSRFWNFCIGGLRSDCLLQRTRCMRKYLVLV